MWGTSSPALVVRGLPKEAGIHSLAGPAIEAAAVVPTAILRRRPVQAAAGAAAAIEHSAALQQRCQVVPQLLHVNNGPAGPVARRWHCQAACSMVLAMGHGLAVQGEASGSLHGHRGTDGPQSMSAGRTLESVSNALTWQGCPLRDLCSLSKEKGACSNRGQWSPEPSCKQLAVQGKASGSLHCSW